MSENQAQTPASGDSQDFLAELKEYWVKIPSKGLFFSLLGAWVLLFHFLGNSTLGYIDTPSLFGWLDYAYTNSADDEHGYLIPFVVLALLWWKRETLAQVVTRVWWPALGLLLLALALHMVGFLVQQTRLSVIGFFVGLYALMGMVWGPRLMVATFFPFFIFSFCLPLASPLEPLTFKLRLLATKITALLSDGALGIHVICDGTRIFDANGTYQYEVAAACSGIRSMTATLAMALIYGFVMFGQFWKRAVMVFSALPLAILANVIRLSVIIIAAETFGQDAGNRVHESSWISMLPYIPALGGIILIGHWLRNDRQSNVPEAGPPLVAGAPSKL